MSFIFFFVFFLSFEWTKFWTKMHENFGISYLNKVLLLAADNALGSNSAADWARRTFRLRFLRNEDLNLRILMQFWLNCLIFIIWMKLRANKDFDVHKTVYPHMAKCLPGWTYLAKTIVTSGFKLFWLVFIFGRIATIHRRV